RNLSRLETHSVLGPDAALAPLGRDENPGVVDDRLHFLERLGCLRAANRRRAAASSCAVSAPCSDSHSATAARPSRTRKARRAPAVIHAETLRPSASAASITSEWT